MPVVKSSTPGGLLSLPVDVLAAIVAKLKRSKDVLSLARVNSALHRALLPIIYNRFDVEFFKHDDDRSRNSGINVIVRGLATLLRTHHVCGEDGSGRSRGIRRGNDYASYVTAFAVWVKDREERLGEPLRNERGRMLNTLVATALPLMSNLTSFTWDIPCGLWYELWSSLAQLHEGRDGKQGKLHTLYVRCHDISESRWIARHSAHRRAKPEKLDNVDQSDSLAHVEYPSYSRMPPLRSLTVLDILEMQHLDEISVLLGKSLATMRELQISIAEVCSHEDWTRPWDGSQYQQIDRTDPVRSTTTIGGRRRGGVLGVLTSAFVELDGEVSAQDDSVAADEDNERTSIPDEVLDEVLFERLTTLCLERVAMANGPAPGIDWTMLTSLTILSCDGHVDFWLGLHKQHSMAAQSAWGCKPSRRKSALISRMNLKSIHLDQVSDAFVHFVRDCLAPDSLEQLLLRLQTDTQSEVSLDELFKRIIRHHQASLRCLLLDSAQAQVPVADDDWGNWARRRKTPSGGKKWALHRVHINFLTSGGMRNLKELGVTVLDGKHWMILLHRLAELPQLRTLYVPHVYNGGSPKIMGAHILHTAELHVGIKLKYFAAQSKCYELREHPVRPVTPSARRRSLDSDGNSIHGWMSPAASRASSRASSRATSGPGSRSAPAHSNDSDGDDFSEVESSGPEVDSDDEFELDDSMRLKLVELPDFDDKIAIFKARKGRLGL